MPIVLKYAITAALVVLVSEVSSRTGYVGGLIASLPLVSYLSIIWLYTENNKEDAVAIISQHSVSVFWFVLPTLPFFLLLPWLLKHLPFAASMAIATAVLFVCYAITMLALDKAGVEVV
ncbi:hypothetical protein OT109_02770 [Phycisphaeraceae bacterium D3-23]